MRRFLIKLLIFLSIPTFFVAQTAYGLVGKSVAEDDIRAWETLSVLEKNDILTGPFYPNVYIEKTEMGTYPKPAGFGVLETVIWQTDKYGYRKDPAYQDNPDIVIIGDSFIGGSGLTQEDMLTEKIQNITGLNTYPYALGYINQFASDKRFRDHPPKIVVLAMVEKLFQSASEIEESKPDNSSQLSGLDLIKYNTSVVESAKIYDRLKKKYFFDFLRAKVYKFLEEARPENVKPNYKYLGINMAIDESMVFSTQSDDYFIPVSDKTVAWNVWKMKTYRDYLEARGIRFIVAVIPNKENIYYKIMQGERKRPDFIDRFNKEAKVAGIELVDLQKSFDVSRDRNPKDLLYHIDDSHWNARGVEIAAREIAKIILDKTPPSN